MEEEGADGGFSALCPELPGIGSQGETIAEAEANLRDAIAGAIAEYRGTTGTIPWQRSLDLVPPANAKERWIVVSG
ncbi:MAG: type II toxin-antitoxin system HicB family antitoxin [Planctomycetes bacterium]|nr:type II toxin-antitoxin system HicB family antitoxin [Planctomycetota bacterium]